VDAAEDDAGARVKRGRESAPEKLDHLDRLHEGIDARSRS
jgi:hypothetical protein